MNISNRPFMILLWATMLSVVIVPFFGDSYEVRKHRVNTAIAHCMADYTDNPFGSEAYKAGCSKCIGLGMAMMDANSQLHILPRDYRIMIESPECRGLKVTPIKPSLPDSWLVRIPKILGLLSFAMLFIANWPARRRKKAGAQSNQCTTTQTQELQ